MPLQLPTNIGPGDIKPHPDAISKKRIQWFLYVNPKSIKKINQEPNGPHIKVLSQEGKIKLLVSEYLKQALDQIQRGRTSRDTRNSNQLLGRTQEIYSTPMDEVFLRALKNSLEGTKSKETPWGPMYQSALIITKSKKKGNMFAKNPAAPWDFYDQDAMDPILENEGENIAYEVTWQNTDYTHDSKIFPSEAEARKSFEFLKIGDIISAKLKKLTATDNSFLDTGIDHWTNPEPEYRKFLNTPMSNQEVAAFQNFLAQRRKKRKEYFGPSQFMESLRGLVEEVLQEKKNEIAASK